MGDSENPDTLSSSQQKLVFEKLRQTVCLSKYVHLMRTIKLVLERKANGQNQRSSWKTLYENYVTRLVYLHFPPSENEEDAPLGNKAMLDLLKKTDLHSSFLREQIKAYVDETETKAKDSYLDVSRVLNKTDQGTYQGMNENDRSVLNHRYILPNSTLSVVEQNGRTSRERASNAKNDIEIATAEDSLHDIEHQLIKSNELQMKLKVIIKMSSEQDQLEFGESLDVNLNNPIRRLHITTDPTAGPSRQNLREEPQHNKPLVLKKTGKPVPVSFTTPEFTKLVELYGSAKNDGKAQLPKQIDHVRVRDEIRQLLKDEPTSTANTFLSMLQTSHKTLVATRKKIGQEYVASMGRRYLASLNRNSDSIKQNEYPCLSLENLLKEIVYSASRRELPKSCFLMKEDDVWSQLEYIEGLVMQFEQTRWHKDAFELLQIGVSPEHGQQLERFVRLAKVHFHLVTEDGRCRRAGHGDFAAPCVYGDEKLYAAFRLYHVLLVRLQTAFLEAGVDSAEWAYRNYCDKAGKDSLRQLNNLASLPEKAKEALGWQQVGFSPSQGTAEEKMEKFLNAVKKREVKSRSSAYKAENFEEDVLRAIGIDGNKLFTITRILTRLRESINQANGTYFDLFEQYRDAVGKEENKAAAEKYEEQCRNSESAWLFKFELQYSDSYLTEEWACNGEKGDASRGTVTIIRAGELLEKSKPEKKRKKATCSPYRIIKKRKKSS